jgi:hypothetical protein
MPTADPQSLPGDPARLLRGEKDNHIGNITRHPNAAQGRVRRHLGFQIHRDPAGLDWAGRHDVDGNPEPAQLHRRRAAV